MESDPDGARGARPTIRFIAESVSTPGDNGDDQWRRAMWTDRMVNAPAPVDVVVHVVAGSLAVRLERKRNRPSGRAINRSRPLSPLSLSSSFSANMCVSDLFSFAAEYGRCRVEPTGYGRIDYLLASLLIHSPVLLERCNGNISLTYACPLLYRVLSFPYFWC